MCTALGNLKCTDSATLIYASFLMSKFLSIAVLLRYKIVRKILLSPKVGEDPRTLELEENVEGLK